MTVAPSTVKSTARSERMKARLAGPDPNGCHETWKLHLSAKAKEQYARADSPLKRGRTKAQADKPTGAEKESKPPESDKPSPPPRSAGDPKGWGPRRWRTSRSA